MENLVYWVGHPTFSFSTSAYFVNDRYLVLSFRRTNMVVYTLKQHREHYFENHGNVAECVRKLHTDFGRREAPSEVAVVY